MRNRGASGAATLALPFVLGLLGLADGRGMTLRGLGAPMMVYSLANVKRHPSMKRLRAQGVLRGGGTHSERTDELNHMNVQLLAKENNHRAIFTQ